MRMRSRRRHAGRRLLGVGAGGVGGLADKHTILTITNDGSGNALVTTAAPHGLSGSEAITISGTSGGTYDGSSWFVDGVPSATTFFLGGSYSIDATGGTWRLT